MYCVIRKRQQISGAVQPTADESLRGRGGSRGRGQYYSIHIIADIQPIDNESSTELLIRVSGSTGLDVFSYANS